MQGNLLEAAVASVIITHIEKYGKRASLESGISNHIADLGFEVVPTSDL